MKTETILCKQCAGDVDPARPGAVLYVPGFKDPLMFCARDCKSKYLVRTRPADLIAAANAENGVGIPTPKKALPAHKRKPSRADILKKIRPKETDISRSIGQQLDNAGVWNTRTQSGMLKLATGHVMKLCRPGTPDRIFVAGLPVWIEVKRPGAVATPEQLKAHAELRANGCLVFVLDDAADLDFILHGLANAAERIQIVRGLIMATQIEIDEAIHVNRAGRQK